MTRHARFAVLQPLWLLTPLGLLLLGWAYLNFGTRASRVYSRLGKVKTGMTRQQVTQLLSPPDTVYRWELDHGPALVLHYDMGFGAPDALRVLIEHDTVTAVVYNQ